MPEFPESYELLSFFEIEPEKLDENVPDFYNTLTYEIIRGKHRLRCIFCPSYGDMDLRIYDGHEPLIELDLSGITQTRILNNKEVEFMEVIFDESYKVFCLMLFIKPYIKISWGMEMKD